jgi:hypothetical protein
VTHCGPGGREYCPQPAADARQARRVLTILGMLLFRRQSGTITENKRHPAFGGPSFIFGNSDLHRSFYEQA